VTESTRAAAFSPCDCAWIHTPHGRPVKFAAMQKPTSPPWRRSSMGWSLHWLRAGKTAGWPEVICLMQTAFGNG